jgi:hypothetical protein
MQAQANSLFIRLRRFIACAGAATAVEFALVAAPF